MPAPALSVEAPCGRLRGLRADGCLVWRGIPYARPPVGALRWLPPQPLPAPWLGERDATHFAARAIQSLSAGPPGRLPPETTVVSEDCLYLNVCRPAGETEALPVLAWIHGGGFAVGSGPDGIGDGTQLAVAARAVIVTFNYRLGPLGFLHLDELTGGEISGSGNAGLLDQVAALRWIQDNIAAFGGDPARVTVMGGSAGAKSIGTLLGAGVAPGLVSRAISMSGGAETVYEPAVATAVAQRYLDGVGVSDNRIETLQEIPASDLLAGQLALGAGVESIWHWRPVIDGVVLHGLPVAAIGAGAAAGIPILIGTNQREAALFASMDPGCLDGVSSVLAQTHGERAEGVLAEYVRAHPGLRRDEVLTMIMTHERYWIPSVRVAQAQSEHADVWMYRYDWRSPHLGELGAAHGSEMPAVWALPGTGADAEVPRAMRAAFAAFIREGSPEVSSLPPWPRYEPAHRMTMLLRDPPEIAADPDGAARELWQDARVCYPTWPRAASRLSGAVTATS